MRELVAPALLVVGWLGCAAPPPPVPAPAAPIPPAPAPTASSAAPAPAGAAAAASPIRVLGQVGDVTVASYPPTGFDRLEPKQRALAYHLVEAARAGDPLFTMQTSRWAWPLRRLVRALVARKDKLPAAFVPKLALLRRMVFVHHGLHDARTGQKLAMPFARAELEEAAKAAGVALPADLAAALFDPAIAPTLTNKTPGKGKDPIVESAANHYEGVTSKDLERFKEKYELNGRVVKDKGKLVEQVYRAGGDGAPPGLGAADLARVVAHLERAIPLAPATEQEALRHLVRYFETGDGEEFRQHDIAWLKQVFSVDYILGFVETYTDVRERKGSFEGFVAIPDPDRDPPLQALAKSAEYFEQRMPWPAELKRSSFRVPAAAAVTVIGAAGDAGPMTFLGVNLPNAQDLREKYGSKNFVVLSVDDTRQELSGAKTIDEFAPAESRAEIHRCARWLEYAATGFHEVTGHGSGKVSPKLAKDPSQLLAPYYSTMEEGRAELVAWHMMGDPKTVEIGLLPDAGCARAFPQYATTTSWLRVKTVAKGDVAEEDHLRADLVSIGFLRDKGAIAVEERGGKTFLVVRDPEAWRKAAGELLGELMRIKAYGDKPALEALVHKYGTRIDPKWRDEIVARLGALGLPSSIATVPPTLTPVMNASNEVVDARAEQTSSLDAYIDRLEAASPE